MKRYKHIASDIIVIKQDSQIRYYCEKSYDLVTIPSVIVENSNEWEEIIETDRSKYFVKEFISIKDGVIWNINSKYKYSTSNELVERPSSFFLDSKNYTINSVARVSDNEIFTVADSLTINTHSPYVITKIEKYKNQFSLLAGRFNIKLSEAIKHKLPQMELLTKDGVTLKHPNSPVYLLLPKGIWEINITKLENIIRRRIIYTNYSTSWLYFATEEARSQYILENKPLISVNELAGLVDVKISAKSMSNLKAHLEGKLLK